MDNTSPAEQTIEHRVKSVISEHLGVSIDQIEDAKSLEELGADSLDNVELAMGFEEEFNIMISDANTERTKLVSDAIGIVYELLDT